MKTWKKVLTGLALAGEVLAGARTAHAISVAGPAGSPAPDFWYSYSACYAYPASYGYNTVSPAAAYGPDDSFTWYYPASGYTYPAYEESQEAPTRLYERDYWHYNF